MRARTLMNAPPSGDDVPDEPATGDTPLWKEPPFVAGVVVLVLLLGVITFLFVGGDGEDPDVVILDTPTPTPTPTVTPPLASPDPTPTPVDPDPQAPKLPEEETENEVRQGNGPDPVEWTGEGSGLSDVIDHEGGLAVVRLAHAGQEDFTAEVVDEDGDRVEGLYEDEDAGGDYLGVLTDSEGRYQGSRALVLEEAAYRVEVTADGPWGMRWTQPRYERAPEVPQTRSGDADSATKPFTVRAPALATLWNVESGQARVTVIRAEGDEAEVVQRFTVVDGQEIAFEELARGIHLLDVRVDAVWDVELD